MSRAKTRTSSGQRCNSQSRQQKQSRSSGRLKGDSEQSRHVPDHKYNRDDLDLPLMADCGSWLETYVSEGIATYLRASNQDGKVVQTEFSFESDHSNLYISSATKLERIVDVVDVKPDETECRFVVADETCKIEALLLCQASSSTIPLDRGARISLKDFRIRISACHTPPKAEIFVGSFRILNDRIVRDRKFDTLPDIRGLPLVRHALMAYAGDEYDTDVVDSPQSVKSQQSLAWINEEQDSNAENVDPSPSCEEGFATQAPLRLNTPPPVKSKTLSISINVLDTGIGARVPPEAVGDDDDNLLCQMLMPELTQKTAPQMQLNENVCAPEKAIREKGPNYVEAPRNNQKSAYSSNSTDQNITGSIHELTDVARDGDQMPSVESTTRTSQQANGQRQSAGEKSGTILQREECSDEQTSSTTDGLSDPFASWRAVAAGGRYIPRYAARIPPEQEDILSCATAWQPALVGKASIPGTVPLALQERLIARADGMACGGKARTTEQSAQEEHGNSADPLQSSTKMNDYCPQPDNADNLAESTMVSSSAWPVSPERPPRSRLPPDSPPAAAVPTVTPELVVVQLDQAALEEDLDNQPVTSSESSFDHANQSQQIRDLSDQTMDSDHGAESRSGHNRESTAAIVQASYNQEQPPNDLIVERRVAQARSIHVQRTPYPIKSEGILGHVQNSGLVHDRYLNGDLLQHTPTASFVPATFRSSPSPRFETQNVLAAHLNQLSDGLLSSGPSKQHQLFNGSVASTPVCSMRAVSNPKSITQELQTPEYNTQGSHSRPASLASPTVQPKRPLSVLHVQENSSKRQKRESYESSLPRSNGASADEDYALIDQALREHRRNVLRPISKLSEDEARYVKPALLEQTPRSSRSFDSGGPERSQHSAISEVHSRRIPSSGVGDLAIGADVARQSQTPKDAGIRNRHSVPPTDSRFADVFRRFRTAYPDYRGNKNDFSAACGVLDNLRREKLAPHPSLYDDVIYHYTHTYCPYMIARLGDFNGTMPFSSFYESQIEEPEHLLRIVKPVFLETIVTIHAATTATDEPDEIELQSTNRGSVTRATSSQSFSFERHSGAESPELGARQSLSIKDVISLGLTKERRLGSPDIYAARRIDLRGIPQKKKTGTSLFAALKSLSKAGKPDHSVAQPHARRSDIPVTRLNDIASYPNKSKEGTRKSSQVKAKHVKMSAHVKPPLDLFTFRH